MFLKHWQFFYCHAVGSLAILFEIFFDISKGVYEHIRSWKKFGYLIKILEASLQEVVDMWGHGDVSTYFLFFCVQSYVSFVENSYF